MRYTSNLYLEEQIHAKSSAQDIKMCRVQLSMADGQKLPADGQENSAKEGTKLRRYPWCQYRLST